MAKNPASSGKTWTPKEVRQLRTEIRQNTPTRVIGLKHDRTPGAVQKKANNLGLLRIGDQVYLVKLYMRKQAMKKPGLDAYGYLVNQTFGKELGWPAVLDVRKKTPFRPAPPPTLKIARMVRAEATALQAHLREGGTAA